ncbi:MAG: ATP-binding protein, partial [Elusimicrobiota bacterium]|nr:ATP-binding protein [Elusimicrobiota bacterium]
QHSKGPHGRLGLGLSIAKDIIQNHEGKIWVESEGLGKGSSFRFTVPFAKEGAEQAAPPEKK